MYCSDDGEDYDDYSQGKDAGEGEFLPGGDLNAVEELEGHGHDHEVDEDVDDGGVDDDDHGCLGVDGLGTHSWVMLDGKFYVMFGKSLPRVK